LGYLPASDPTDRTSDRLDNDMNLSSWMGWENGVAVAARTRDTFTQPNLFVFAVDRVQTEFGTSAIAFVTWKARLDAPPRVHSIVVESVKITSPIVEHLVKGTPWEGAPLEAGIVDVNFKARKRRLAVDITGTSWTVELRLGKLAEPIFEERPPGEGAPFGQRLISAAAESAKARLDGTVRRLRLAEGGPFGGAPAAWLPSGLFFR